MVHLKDSGNWGTKGLGGEQDTEELRWRLDNREECGSGREKRETNPSPA